MTALDPSGVRKGFLVAPLAAPALLVVVSIVVGVVVGVGSGEPRTVVASVFGSWPWLMFALPVSYGITYLFGIPIFVLLRNYHRACYPYWVSVSAGLGFIIGAGVGAVLADRYGSVEWIVWLAIFGTVSGASNGWLFWYVVARDAQPRAAADSHQRPSSAGSCG